MRVKWLRRCSIVAVLAGLSGCASDVRNMVSDVRRQGTEIELVDTPFFAQVTDQCGPSALASILDVSGVTVTPEVLKSRVYIPGREGSLQIELMAATRVYKRIPYLIDPEIMALLSELRDGRPVLVLQNLGTKIAPVWHYAVVVGYLPNEKRFVLRSGDQSRHLVRVSRFVRTWKRAEYWGIVALRPGEFPAVPNANKFIRSVAAVEAVGDLESAVAGYRAATERWPQEPLAWLGLGNTFYTQGNLESAEGAYKGLLVIDPHDAVALNNLSQVQADRGSYDAAAATLATALSVTEPNSAKYRIIEESLAQIEARRPISD